MPPSATTLFHKVDDAGTRFFTPRRNSLRGRNSRLGTAVAGINDLIFAAEGADPGGRTDADEVYVVLGRGD